MGYWIVQLCAGLSLAAAQQFPAWTAPWLDPLIIPYGGSSLAANVSHASVFRATLQLGTYNMAPMFDYFNGSFLVTWKNSPQVRAFCVCRFRVWPVWQWRPINTHLYS